MKVFLSSDIEGTAGIVDWGQVLGEGEYALGRRLLLAEVNAADGNAAANAWSASSSVLGSEAGLGSMFASASPSRRQKCRALITAAPNSTPRDCSRR